MGVPPWKLLKLPLSLQREAGGSRPAYRMLNVIEHLAFNIRY